MRGIGLAEKSVMQPFVRAEEMVLQDEAFHLWTEEWGSIYEEGSASRELLKKVADTWFLVSVVDNDYVKGDLFSVFALPHANGKA